MMRTSSAYALLVLLALLAGGSGVAAQEWSLTGNAGTDPTANFLGTTDDEALELRVNDERALRIEPAKDLVGSVISVNLIGGFKGNLVLPGVIGGTIAGGGRVPFADSPEPNVNRVTDDLGTVGGGAKNQAGNDNSVLGDASNATVGGGSDNVASGSHATVGGGTENRATDLRTTVGGGGGNQAGGGDPSGEAAGEGGSLRPSVAERAIVPPPLTPPSAEARVTRPAAKMRPSAGAGTILRTDSGLR